MSASTASTPAASLSATTGKTSAARLAELRGEIDRIDAEMHRLLIERSEIVDALIATKGTQSSGQAFRPGREADMMRRLAERHHGILPLDTAENIWRVIISTFTYVQAPFSVHADVSSGDAPIRDSARFHFGFTVPYVPHAGAEAVISAVARSVGDLGIFRPDQKTAVHPWWEALRGRDAPKIIARLPFIERPDHPAGTPLFVVSKPLEDAAVREIVLVAAKVERWREDIQETLAAVGAEITGSAGVEGGLSLLVAVAGETGPDAVSNALAQARVGRVEAAEVGSHARRFLLP
ncbi:chorismate mutase [Pseudochelatococcus lubricantis]|uniref:chorismate mutase n=1 Tax=Pseudochelatococcus lubricantis TaxID=1538102 RepID=UPI0035F08155